METRSPGPESDTIIMPDGQNLVVTTRKPQWRLPVDGTALYNRQAPALNHDTIYGLMVYAHSSLDPQSLTDTIDCSEEYDLIPKDAPPEPLTQENFLRALGPDSTIYSYDAVGKSVIINGSAPTGVMNDLAMVLKFGPLFGNQDSGYSGDVTLGGEDGPGQERFSVTFTKSNAGSSAERSIP